MQPQASANRWHGGISRRCSQQPSVRSSPLHLGSERRVYSLHRDVDWGICISIGRRCEDWSDLRSLWIQLMATSLHHCKHLLRHRSSTRTSAATLRQVTGGATVEMAQSCSAWWLQGDAKVRQPEETQCLMLQGQSLCWTQARAASWLTGMTSSMRLHCGFRGAGGNHFQQATALTMVTGSLKVPIQSPLQSR